MKALNSNQQAVLDTLKATDAPLWPCDIGVSLSMKNQAVGPYLKQLKQMGLVIRQDTGAWKCAEPSKVPEQTSSEIQTHVVVTVEMLFEHNGCLSARDLLTELIGCISHLEDARIIDSRLANEDNVAMVARFRKKT